MIVVGIDPAAATPHTLQDVRATFGEYWTANVDEALALGPTARLSRAGEISRANRPFEDLGEIQQPAGSMPDVPMLTAEQATDRYGHLGLKWDREVASREAEILAERRTNELQADAIFRAARARAGNTEGLGLVRGAASVTAELMASAVDPINLAASLVPWAGPAWRAASIGMLGPVGGRAAIGALEGAVGNLVLEPFMAASDRAEQRDWDLLDAFVNVAAGGVLGGSFGALGGWFGRPRTGPASSPPGSAPIAGAPQLPGAPPPPTLGAYASGWRAALQDAGVAAPAEFNALVRASVWNPRAPIVQALEAVSPETRGAAFRAGFAQLLTGKSIDVEPVLRTDPDWRSPLADPLERLRIQVETRALLALPAPRIERADPLAPAATAGRPDGSQLYFDLDPMQIGVDARRFQFKAGGDTAGVTDRLQGVTRWDQRLAGVAIVWKDAAGKLWIVDGHQRLGLAKRLAGEGQEPKIHALLLDESLGETEGYARAMAGFKNIAEGTGTAIDAAKVLREIRRDPTLRTALNDGRLPPLPPRSALVRDAESLAKLSDDAFGMVANGKVEPNQAAHVARIIADPAEQTAAMGVLAKLQPDTAEQARLVVEQMREAGFRAETTADLFGGRELANALLLERARVLEATGRRLKQDAAVFRTLVDREGIAAEAGNILARDANLERLSDDRAALAVLEALAGRAGPVAAALNDAARAVSEGRPVRRAVDDVLKALRAEASQFKRPATTSIDPAQELQLFRERSSGPAAERLGDPAAAERQKQAAGDRQSTDLVKVAESEQPQLDLLAQQAIEANPAIRPALELVERQFKQADELAAAVDGLAACKGTGGLFE